jgi:hypothetical protein
MTREANVYIGALPLSVPEQRERLQSFIGGKGPRGIVVVVRLGNEAVEQRD